MRRAPGSDDAAAICDAIVTAAEQVLEDDGLDDFSTNRVAKRAGVSVGSLYRYFPNKFALARAVFERHLVLYQRVIVECGGRAKNVHDFAEQWGLGMLELFEQRPRIHQALWRLRTAAEVHDQIAHMLGSVTDITRAVLESAGVPPPRSSDLAFLLVHAADGVANAIALRSDPVLARRTVALVAELAATAAAALRPPAP